MDKSIKIPVILYIISLLILAAFGFIGDTNDETIDFASKYFSEREIDTGREFFLYGMITGTSYRVIAILFIIFIAVKGYWERFADWLSSKIKSDYLIIFIPFVIIFISLAFIAFPFALFYGFYVRQMFGLMNTDILTWISRHILATSISILISGAGISIFILLIKKTKRYIIYVPAAFLLISIAATIIYPRFITPLFYDIEKLPQSSLKVNIEKLFNRANIDIEDIYVINKSKYSNAANAYMIGLGPDRRVVLCDTLLDNFTDDEVLSVIAHEAGHYVEEHMLIGIFIAALGIMLALTLLAIISKYLSGKNLNSYMGAEFHSSILVFLILFIFISKPAHNSISRQIEKRADSYAIEMTGNPDVFIQMESRLTLTNKSYILPNPVYVWFYRTHPAVLERIKNAGGL